MIDGSRFIGAATGVLHAHHRRASAEKDFRSIDVRMGGEAAVTTGEGSLALAIAPVDGSALGTFLAAVSGVDLHERPATLLKFVGQRRFEAMPALFENQSVEAALPAPLPRHSRCVQILDHSNAKAPDKAARGRAATPALALTAAALRTQSQGQDK